MQDDHTSHGPSTNPESQPLAQSPMIPPAPQQGTVPDSSNHDADQQEDTARELAREFGLVEKFQIGTNILLAVVGIAALVIYNGQLKEMRKATKATQTAAQAAADNAIAARNQSQIATEAYESSRESFKLDQRPYITVAELMLKSPPAYGDNEISLKLHNTGKTPAVNVETIPRVSLGDKRAPLRRPGNANVEISHSVMASGGILGDSFVLELGTKEVWEIQAGHALIFRAEIRYSDIFKDWHKTKICARYDPQSNFVFCTTGNEVE